VSTVEYVAVYVAMCVAAQETCLEASRKSLFPLPPLLSPDKSMARNPSPFRRSTSASPRTCNANRVTRLQCAATCCNMLQHNALGVPTNHNVCHPAATHCSARQNTATHCNTHCNTCFWRPHEPDIPPLRCNTLQNNTLQHTATHCKTLQHTAIHCNILQRTLQHTATNCCTLLHTALQHTALGVSTN